MSNPFYHYFTDKIPVIVTKPLERRLIVSIPRTSSSKETSREKSIKNENDRETRERDDSHSRKRDKKNDKRHSASIEYEGEASGSKQPNTQEARGTK
jgi:hypothetical protein